LENGEAEKIAHFLGVDVYEFTERFTMLAPGRTRLSLTEQSNGHCVFLEKNNTCRIQPVKPIQCTGFPYTWSSHDLLDGCEGMRRMKERDLAETQR
jgi:Fe-S-cluster containining protein